MAPPFALPPGGSKENGGRAYAAVFRPQRGFWAACGLGGVILIVAALAATDFDRAFTIFHSIFFPGKENWLFDPATDPVILLLPEEFFRNCAIAIAVSLLGLCLVLVLTGRKQKK